jgi:hypothetical protein
MVLFMPNTLKNYGCPITFARIFVRPKEKDTYDLIHFKEADLENDVSALECPDNWGTEAARLLKEQAAIAAIPENLRPIEENTVPSWLWKNKAASDNTTDETSTRQIFNRVVGSAAYLGWKEGMFANEPSARAFFDEARYALSQRFIAIEPKLLAKMGLDWAYGMQNASVNLKTTNSSPEVDITNTVIDSIVCGSRDKAIRSKWNKVTHFKSGTTATSVRFTDIAMDWGTTEQHSMRAMIDLMAFRHNDGSINIEALCHAVRLITVLLDAQGITGTTLAIGFSNLAPLLLALALPYDSDAARAMAAAISSIITAESYATSAQLAGLRGMSPAFIERREMILRSMRNHRRAAYGETNDYEKISVLPVSLKLESCPDLAVVAAARASWDDALQLAQNSGLRHLGATTLTPWSDLSFFMESTAEGAAPMSQLVQSTMFGDTHNSQLHPSVYEALSRLGYDASECKTIVHYALGASSLEKAPHINAKSLRAHGFTEAVLGQIDAYLPQAKTIRFVFTPWILGETFCRKVLKLTSAQINNPGFNILQHLGFKAEQITAADAHCFGHQSLRYCSLLKAKHHAVFLRREDLSAESQIRMSAALQAHMSGETGLEIHVSSAETTEHTEKLLLTAWRQGIKSLKIMYEEKAQPLAAASKKTNHVAVTLTKNKTARQIKPSTFVHAKKAVPAHKERAKASASLAGKASKNAETTKASRRNWSR